MRRKLIIYKVESESFDEIFQNYLDKTEIWKKIEKLFRLNSKYEIVDTFSFHGDYYISSFGRLKINEIIRNTAYDKSGYLCNGITDINGKCQRFKRHQIVMQTFCIDKYKEKYTVDHIIRYKKYDNSIYNLRWADKHVQVYNRENVDYKLKKVICLNDSNIFNSCQEAERFYGLIKNTVSRVARKDRNSIHGYRFEYII